jgi:protein translocase SecG subunit
MSFQIVLIIHMMLAFGLIALILMQHGKGADAGAAFGAGASGSVFGARGANSFMYKLTASIAVGFFILGCTSPLKAIMIDRPGMASCWIHLVKPRICGLSSILHCRKNGPSE